MLGIQDAEHQETAPGASQLVIHKLACSLAGTTEVITIVPGTLTHRAYSKSKANEQFACSYGLNPEFRERINDGKLCIAAVGSEGEARVIELRAHRFFVATLFLPQRTSSAGQPHPLIVAYLRAARDFRAARQSR